MDSYIPHCGKIMRDTIPFLEIQVLISFMKAVRGQHISF